MKLRRIVTAVAIGGVVAMLAGCSDLKTDLPSPVAPGVQVHQKDWIDTASANFHGDAIRAANWDMRSCQSCHGALYDGGTAGVSCRKCHADAAGPENCSTCHGSPTSVAPPTDLNGNTSRSARGVGAHQIHLRGSSIAGTLLCAQCHTTPGSVYDPGHITATNRAIVHFNEALANTSTNKVGTIDYDPELPTYHPSPAYDQTTLQCSNSYCHGYFKNGNLTNVPTWNDTTGASGLCGTCHGDVTQPLNTVARSIPTTTAQGGTHPNVVALGLTNCVVCHGDVVDENFRIINTSKHINGKLDVLGREVEW